MDHFTIVKPLCRAALVHSGNAPEVRRRVAQLRNRLRQGGEAEVAAELGALLDRFAPPRSDRDFGEGPTPETRAKHGPDTVDALYRLGTIGEAEKQAAEEILEVWEGLGAGLFPKALDPLSAAESGGSGAKAGRSAGLERMKPGTYALWRDHWAPWAEWGDGERVVDSNIVRYTALQLTIDVVFDRKGLREIERAYALTNGVLTPRLVRALEMWVEKGRASRAARAAAERGQVA